MSWAQFLGRIVARIPPPRSHLIRYHGVFAPHSRHRERIVPDHSKRRSPTPTAPSATTSPHTPPPSRSRLDWAASAPSFRDRCASLLSLRRSPPAPVHDHRAQDRPENSQPPWHASPGPLPIPRPSAPTHPRFSRLERSSSGRSNPIELVELSSPPQHHQPLQPRQRDPCHRPVRRPITDTNTCCFPHRSATVWRRMSGAVGEPGTIQSISSRTMQPKPRLNFLSTRPSLAADLDPAERIPFNPPKLKAAKQRNRVA